MPRPPKFQCGPCPRCGSEDTVFRFRPPTLEDWENYCREIDIRFKPKPIYPVCNDCGFTNGPIAASVLGDSWFRKPSDLIWCHRCEREGTHLPTECPLRP